MICNKNIKYIIIAFMVIFTAVNDVFACDQDPTASLSVSPNPVCVGCVTCLDGSNSSDPDGGSPELEDTNYIKKFEWDFNYDGVPAHFNADYTEEYPCDGKKNVIPDVAGIYHIGLRVTDNDEDEGGESDHTDITIRTLYAVIVDKIVKSETTDQGPIYVCLNGSVDLEAFNNLETQSFPSGEPHWSIQSQPTGANASLTPSSGSSTTLGNLTKEGNYVVQAKCGSTDTGDSIIVKVRRYKLIVDAPDDITSGDAFTVTVSAVEFSTSQPYTEYLGTIHFTTDDDASNITLPSNYTFTEEDEGVHTFTNAVTLRTVEGTGHTRWIMASDTSDNVAPDDDTMNMWFSVTATVEFYRNCPWPDGPLSYGATTACVPGGLPPDSVFVALPSTTVPCNTGVIVKYGDNSQTAPLKDRGPKTTSDAYWNDDGLPEYPGHAIDLSDGLASDLGISYGCNGSTPYGGGNVKWRFE